MTPLEQVEEHKRRVEMMDVIDADALVVAPDANPVDFLMALYRDVRQPMSRRLRAAIECAPYVHSTFKATAILTNASFAERLDRAVARSKGEGLNLIETSATNVSEGAEQPIKTDCRLPSSVNYKRLRRL